MRLPVKAIAALCVLVALSVATAPLWSADAKPSDALVALEREVGLRLAHVRDEGPVDPGKRKLMLEAARDDAKGEQALKAGDYKAAEDDFRHTGQLLDQIGI